MYRIAVLTISDRSAEGRREDLSGPAAVTLLSEALKMPEISTEIIADERGLIEQSMVRLTDQERMHLIVTSGGTGLSPRDVTPQATEAVCDYLVPGLAELMRSASLKHTPMAALSRAVSGVRGRTLIINLPGSPRAVRECLEAIIPVLPHALEQLASGAGHED